MKTIKAVLLALFVSGNVYVAANVCAQTVATPQGERQEKLKGDITVSALEDLMREHGVLRRILLIYEKELSDLQEGKNPHYDVISKSADIIHSFIEGYHEKLEEDYIFPVFENAGKLRDLTKDLRQQHEAGRKLTLVIMQLSKGKPAGSKESADALAANLRSFIRMYRPHAAREDTVLFPALRGLISEKEYGELGDKFEDKEHELFGENGFEGKVKEVARLEKELNIYELSQFTPNQ